MTNKLWADFYWKARDLVVDLLPPLISRQVARHVTSKVPALRQRPGIGTGPNRLVQRVSTLEELDEWLRRADAAGQVSDDQLRRVFDLFEFVVETKLPPDPFSAEYAAAQRELYRMIAGRSYY
jgi:hypothetical protein